MGFLPLLTALFAVASSTPSFASNPDKPHPHQGVAPKFTHPEPTSLKPNEVALLEGGGLVRRQVRYEDDTGGRGIAIQDVKASRDTVWDIIVDYPSYPAWVDHLDECEIYRRTGDEIYVRFKLAILGMDVEYWIHHTWKPDQGYMTWQLDYARQSDLDDSTGYWLVYDAPGRPGYTRVEYTVDLRLSGWVPGVIEDALANKGLEKATSWVKKQAEARG